MENKLFTKICQRIITSEYNYILEKIDILSEVLKNDLNVIELYKIADSLLKEIKIKHSYYYTALFNMFGYKQTGLETEIKNYQDLSIQIKMLQELFDSKAKDYPAMLKNHKSTDFFNFPLDDIDSDIDDNPPF